MATVSGELDALSTGVVYCELVCALQGLALYDVAEQWTEAMERWCETNAIGSLHGRCRVHRAEILRLRGSCHEAQRQALMACEELRPYLRRELGWPLNELGRIRLHQRDIAGAEQACWPLIGPGGIPNRVSPWCVWPKATWPLRRPRYETPSSIPCECRPRSDHRTPTCSAPRCSRRRSRSPSRPATSTGPDRPPTSSISSPPDSRARRWSPAPPTPADGCGSPTAMRRAQNNPCPKRCDCGTKSAPPTKRPAPASASPTPTTPAAANSGPTWSAKRPARSSRRSKPRQRCPQQRTSRTATHSTSSRSRASTCFGARATTGR